MGDRDIVLAAVSQNWQVLASAAPQLKADQRIYCIRDIIRAASLQKPRVCKPWFEIAG